MQRNKYKFNRSDENNDYQKGYRDGMQDSFDESELDAYYAGVGYGKMEAKDKFIGFNSDRERRAFDRGVINKDQHFNAHQVQPMSFLQRLFGFGRKNASKQKVKRKKVRTKSKKVSKKYGKKQSYKKNRRR